MYVDRGLDLEDLIRHEVTCGFDDRETMVEGICRLRENADEDEVEDILDEALEEHAQEQTAWPDVTDCDRLDRAFEALEDDAIVTRHNFTCCNNCGHDEIVDEIATAREAGRRVDGYVFYHWQDTDHAADGGDLCLRYGGTIGHSGTAIGERIVAALRAAGLAPTWNGDPTKVISIAPFDWKRRGPPRTRTISAEVCVAAWCEALPRATVSAAAANAGVDFPRALDTAGFTTEAMTWAHAPYVAGDRACALARLSVARRSPDLLVEAWQLAPWDREGTFVTLMQMAGLDDPRVRAIAAAKVDECGHDEFGGAAAAWLAALVPDAEDARACARSIWKQREFRCFNENALAALAAALWRAGDDDIRGELGEHILCSLGAWGPTAAIAGARTPDETIALVDEKMSGLPFRLRACDRLVELGAIDRARTFAENDGDAMLAYLAWRLGEPLDKMAELADEHAELRAEDLISAEQLDMIRLAVAAVQRDGAALCAMAEQACADALADGREAALARLDGRIRVPTSSELEAALVKWQQPDIRLSRRSGPRHGGCTILSAAADHARRGELDRARELYAIVLAPYAKDKDRLSYSRLDDQLIELWVAFGELDRVSAYKDVTEMSGLALSFYIPALVAAGQRDKALTLLGTGLARAKTRLELLELIPAVLAVADGAAPTLQAAWRLADQSLASLAIEPQTSVPHHSS